MGIQACTTRRPKKASGSAALAAAKKKAGPMTPDEAIDAIITTNSKTGEEYREIIGSEVLESGAGGNYLIAVQMRDLTGPGAEYINLRFYRRDKSTGVLKIAHNIKFPFARSEKVFNVLGTFLSKF